MALSSTMARTSPSQGEEGGSTPLRATKKLDMKGLRRFPTTFTLPNRKLKVKFGIDPTSDKLHLGHLIPLQIVKEFKDRGDQIDIVIGTFTAQLGDPSGKNSMRPILSFDETLKNSESVILQVKKILGNDINIHLNHTWFENMSMIEMMNLMSKFTVGNLLSRDSFQKRMNDSNPIGMHELMVPILQGLDSVFLKSDVEVGGTDQLFNFKISRELQVVSGQEPENCLLAPIINGTDGRKMSKTFNNCIFINDTSQDIFGKCMSISDDTMEEWCQIFLSDLIITHPMIKKKNLAHKITHLIWGLDFANDAMDHFERVIQCRNIPDEISETSEKNLLSVVKKLRNTSISQSRRLLESNAVRVNNVIVNNVVDLSPGDIVKVGKRDFVKIS
jgi:tyrosyl-tRNA synthetase